MQRTSFSKELKRKQQEKQYKVMVIVIMVLIVLCFILSKNLFASMSPRQEAEALFHSVSSSGNLFSKSRESLEVKAKTNLETYQQYQSGEGEAQDQQTKSQLDKLQSMYSDKLDSAPKGKTDPITSSLNQETELHDQKVNQTERNGKNEEKRKTGHSFSRQSIKEMMDKKHQFKIDPQDEVFLGYNRVNAPEGSSDAQDFISSNPSSSPSSNHSSKNIDKGQGEALLTCIEKSYSEQRVYQTELQVSCAAKGVADPDKIIQMGGIGGAMKYEENANEVKYQIHRVENFSTGNGDSGAYTPVLSFHIGDLDRIQGFFISSMHFKTLLMLKVNGRLVFSNGLPGDEMWITHAGNHYFTTNYMEKHQSRFGTYEQPVYRKVQETTPSSGFIDLKPYLLANQVNTIRIQVVYRAYGHYNIDFRVGLKTECSKWNESWSEEQEQVQGDWKEGWENEEKDEQGSEL